MPQTDNFNTNPQSGSVTLSKALSRDEPDGYATWQFNVKATDSSNSEGYALVSLILKDINDHSPSFDTCCLLGIAPENPQSKNSCVLLFFLLGNQNADNVELYGDVYIRC